MFGVSHDDKNLPVDPKQHIVRSNNRTVDLLAIVRLSRSLSREERVVFLLVIKVCPSLEEVRVRVQL